jgi:hypothetical protein
MAIYENEPPIFLAFQSAQKSTTTMGTMHAGTMMMNIPYCREESAKQIKEK